MLSDRVIKLLQLTRSENDHEALAAIRKANELVKNWAESDNGEVSIEDMLGFLNSIENSDHPVIIFHLTMRWSLHRQFAPEHIAQLKKLFFHYKRQQ